MFVGTPKPGGALLRRFRLEWDEARAPFAILTVIVFLAILLRAMELNYCMTPDEAYSHDEIMRSGWQGILLMPYGSANHPFASLGGWIGGTLFGDHDWAYQLYPFLTGMLSIPLIYLVAARAFRDKRVGWLAAFLLAVSPYHAAYSANMRGYVPAMCCGLLYVYFLIACFERPRWMYLPIMGLALAAMAMNHLASMMMLGPWGLIVALFTAIPLLFRKARRPGYWKSAIVACGGIGFGMLLVELGYSPVFSLFHSAYSRFVHGAWPEAMNLYLSGAEQPEWHPFFRYTEVLTGMHGYVFLFPVALALLGVIPALRKRSWGTGLIVVSALLPPAALLTVHLRLVPRYLMSLLPFLAILTAAGIAYLAAAAVRKSPRAAFAVTLAGLAALTAGVSPFYLHAFPHGLAYCSCVISDFKSATRYTAEHARENDIILFNPLNYEPLNQYFSRYIYPEFPVVQPASARRVWYVTDSFDKDVLGALSPHIPLSPDAYFRECAVWSAELSANRFLEAALPPFYAAAKPWPACFAPWNVYAFNIAHSACVAGAGVDDASPALLIAERDGNATFFLESPKLPCAPGVLTMYQAQLLGDSSTQSLGIGVRYYSDNDASPIIEETNWEPQPAASPASAPWNPFQICTFSPPEATSISVFWQIRETYAKQAAAGFKAPRLWMDTP